MELNTNIVKEQVIAASGTIPYLSNIDIAKDSRNPSPPYVIGNRLAESINGTTSNIEEKPTLPKNPIIK